MSGGGPRTATLRVFNIPRTALAGELSAFFETNVGPVFACRIATSRQNWKSKGTGRVQFCTADAAELALRLSESRELRDFQRARLSLAPSPDDIVVRPADPRNRVEGAVLFVGNRGGPSWFDALESWTGIRWDVMPEKQKMHFWVAMGDEGWFRMELFFRDIVGTFGCFIAGQRAVLINLKFAPRIFHTVQGNNMTSKCADDRYYVCKEVSQFTWVRTTDFSTICSIGQSTHFCVALPNETSVSEIVAHLPLYEELGNLSMTQGEPFQSSIGLVPIINTPSSPLLAYEILFLLNSLVHTQKISCKQVNIDLFSVLSGMPIAIAKAILMKMRQLTSTCYEPIKFINDQLANVIGSLKSRNPRKSAENLTHCHRVLVTPTRVYFMGPEVEKSNYVVMHHFAHASNFIRLQFVEEDCGKIMSDVLSTTINHDLFSKPHQTKVYSRILSVLRDGISIGGKHFDFLAFSASQLRSSSVWMFASTDTVTAKSIREWMGSFQKIRNVSKCAARMGQLFSSSVQTFNVYPQEVEIIPDVEVTTDGIKYCFSDGIGKISASFALQVAKKCGLHERPSAFQIRYGGYKGVISVDHSSFHKLSLRPSMLKFDSINTMLCIAKWSESLPCFLNREIIALLSTLGVKDESFESLQHEQLQLLGDILISKESALKFLNSMGGSDAKTAVQMLEKGYHPNAEPYLLMMLKAYCMHHLSDVRSKCRIFVPRGRVLLGCLDESGNLNYGQVYIRVTLTSDELRNGGESFFEKVDETTAIVIGKVVVTKNPCLHPGDIRVLQAVRDDDLEESGFVDCIVFPQKGLRPHPNECSGGDLDGDLYFACWDEKLFPTVTHEPMDYTGRRPRITDHEVTLQEIHKFFVDYMISDSLGAISTAHLVHADCEPSKAQSSKCLQLANLHSMAVDFAKTGAPAEMPKVLRPKVYPDFMERLDRPSYKSTNVLGKLYRATVGWIEENHFDSLWSGSIEVAYDHDLEVEGFKSFLEVALEFKMQYAEKFVAMMKYYGAEKEEEILTGNLKSRSNLDKSRNREIKDRILAGLKSLQKEVSSWLGDYRTEDNVTKLASACYHVTYHPDYMSDLNLISFPWTFYDVLLSIKSKRTQNS